MRAHLAAIGCKGQEISRAHLAAIGCNGLMILENFMLVKIFRYMVCGPVFNILSHPVTYIMYFITENEAPPPHVPLSGPPHQLSKSLLKYIVMTSCRFHAQSDGIIAEHLSARLLILQCVFSFDGLWP